MEKIKYDTNIYDWIIELGSISAYEYLDGDKDYRENQKSLFLAGEIVNPVLDYPQIDINKLEYLEENLLAFRNLMQKDNVVYEDSMPQEMKSRISQFDENTRKAYIYKINEKIAEIRLLKITSKLKVEATEDQIEKRILNRKFRKYSEFIYGKPNQEIFNYSFQQITNLIKQAKNKDIDTSELEALIGNTEPDTLAIPNSETFERAKEITNEEISSLVDIKNFDEDIDVEHAKIYFEEAIRSLGAEGWNIVIENSSRKSMHVSQEEKKIVIPEGKKFPINKLKELIVHEIGTHVARRVNGERSKLMLLGIGLDRYKDDEGIATAREQILESKFDEYSGFDAHIAIGLCYGLDGIKRDFREVFEIMYRIYTIQAKLNNESGDVESKAKVKAWNRCVRTFRGTSCNEKGVCFTKDIFYRESNQEIWKIFETNPNLAMSFSIGKFDPANKRHLLLLSELDILDSDLIELEK